MSDLFDRFWNNVPTRTAIRNFVDGILLADAIPDCLFQRRYWEDRFESQKKDYGRHEVSAVLEGAFLRKVRDPLNPERAAQLWKVLACKSSQIDPPARENYYRWYPTPAVTDVDALSMCEAIASATSDGVNYTVPFPVIILENDVVSGHAIIECRVTVLSRRDSQLADALLAPFSEFILEQDTLEGVERKIRKVPSLPQQATYLLEFRPVAGQDFLETSLFGGDSLDLAVTLAALTASQSHASLRPVIPSGRIDLNAIGTGRPEIADIGGFKAKWEAVKRYADARQEKVIFLVAQGSGQTYEKHSLAEVKNAPTRLSDLERLVLKDLSDDCSSYKEFLSQTDELSPDIAPPREFDRDEPGSYDREDVAQLDRFAAEAIKVPTVEGTEVGHALVVLPFGNDPVSAAKHVARKVHELAGQAVTDVQIPLLLPLTCTSAIRTAEPSRRSDRLLSHLIQGLRDVKSEGLLSEDALSNLLLRSARRLLFVAYDRPSLELGYEKDGSTVSSVFEELKSRAAQARVVILASDFHHALWLESLGVVSEEALATWQAAEIPVGGSDGP